MPVTKNASLSCGPDKLLAAVKKGLEDKNPLLFYTLRFTEQDLITAYARIVQDSTLNKNMALTLLLLSGKPDYKKVLNLLGEGASLAIFKFINKDPDMALNEAFVVENLQMVVQLRSIGAKIDQVQYVTPNLRGAVPLISYAAVIDDFALIREVLSMGAEIKGNNVTDSLVAIKPTVSTEIIKRKIRFLINPAGEFPECKLDGIDLTNTTTNPLKLALDHTHVNLTQALIEVSEEQKQTLFTPEIADQFIDFPRGSLGDRLSMLVMKHALHANAQLSQENQVDILAMISESIEIGEPRLLLYVAIDRGWLQTAKFILATRPEWLEYREHPPLHSALNVAASVKRTSESTQMVWNIVKLNANLFSSSPNDPNKSKYIALDKLENLHPGEVKVDLAAVPFQVVIDSVNEKAWKKQRNHWQDKEFVYVDKPAWIKEIETTRKLFSKHPKNRFFKLLRSRTENVTHNAFMVCYVLCSVAKQNMIVINSKRAGMQKAGIPASLIMLMFSYLDISTFGVGDKKKDQKEIPCGFSSAQQKEFMDKIMQPFVDRCQPMCYARLTAPPAPAGHLVEKPNGPKRRRR